MKVAITGVSGLLGRTTAQVLSAAGHNVLGIGRKDSHGQFVKARLDSLEQLPSVLTGVDFVVHAAGKATGEGPADILMANAVGKNCDIAEIPIISFSSLAVYGMNDLVLADESSLTNPVSLYGKRKLGAEKALNESGATVCHLRIGNVHSPMVLSNILLSLIHI